MTACQCPGWYEGCTHDNPCGSEVEPKVAEERGPWCVECNPRRAAAAETTLDQMVAMLTEGADTGHK